MFEDAVTQVLKDEGGFFHNQLTGEIVNFGITLSFMKAVVDKTATEDTIKNLTQNGARVLYKEYFWNKPGINNIHDPKIASLLFYLSVNMGIPSAIKLIQQACTSLGKKVTEDGVLGPVSIATINSLDPVKLHATLCAEAKNRYMHIGANAKLANNLAGWLARLDRYAKDPPTVSA